MKLSEFIESLKKKHPKIDLYEDGDFEWSNQGRALLDAGNIKGARKKFEQLMLSQPQHLDGPHGLSVIYHKEGEKQMAKMLINRAIEIGEGCLERNDMDPYFVNMMKSERLEIESMPA